MTTKNNWVIHDLRRTTRTNLSRLPIPGMVGEVMIAHAQPGLHQVYNEYSYLDEKQHGFQPCASRVAAPYNPATVHPRIDVMELQR